MKLRLEEELETPMKRYEIIGAYNPQDNSRKAIRERINSKYNKICVEEIERLIKEKRSIISVKVKKRGFDKEYCKICKRDSLMRNDINFIQLEKIGGFYQKVASDSKHFFRYCFRCGHVES